MSCIPNATKGSSDEQASFRSLCCVIRDSCGNDPYRSPAAFADTYCGEASSTAEAYWNNGYGSHPFDVHSPVTGQDYTMTCTNAGSVCQGGNNAIVYLRR